MDLYKIVVVLWIFVIACLHIRMYQTGQVAKHTNRSRTAVMRHTVTARYLLIATLLLVFLIEGGVLINGRSERDVVFWVHLVFAIAYTLSVVVLYFWYNGMTHPNHKYLAYFAMANYAIVACIGIPMLYKRFA